VGIFQSGAYALSASPVDFLSHPFPAEVLVRDGRVDVIRARGSRQP
jgi:diaminopimelate decarboxylase